MKRVYQAGSLQEAYLLVGLLAGEGIETRVFNESAQGALGEIPFPQAWPEIWVVDDERFERASEIIDTYEHQQTTGESVACTHCRERNPANFDFCWSCGRNLEKN